MSVVNAIEIEMYLGNGIVIESTQNNYTLNL